jgi:hypothetical protein
MTTWAFLYGRPGTDPHTDRTVIERDGLRTVLVPVPDESQAPAIAVELIESDAIALLELCGGFGAVDGRVSSRPYGGACRSGTSPTTCLPQECRWCPRGGVASLTWTVGCT